jgi:hypothetical protein
VVVMSVMNATMHVVMMISAMITVKKIIVMV